MNSHNKILSEHTIWLSLIIVFPLPDPERVPDRCLYVMAVGQIAINLLLVVHSFCKNKVLKFIKILRLKIIQI